MFKHLNKAIDELAVGPGDIRNRLVYAGEHYTAMSIECIPEHLRPLATEILEYLTEYKAKPGASFPFDSDIRVTMRRRRTRTAVRTAEKMWSLYWQYRSALGYE